MASSDNVEAAGGTATPLARRVLSRALAALILIIGALDSVSTEMALSTGAAVEANPVIRFLQETLGPLWIAVKMAIHGLLAFAVLRAPTRPMLLMMSLVTALTLAAAVNNLAIFAAYTAP